jgi:transcriptional regulator with XRE-family HTH domain
VSENQLARFLRANREKLRLTQADVLERLATYHRYSPAAIVHWESGRSLPPIDDPRFVRILASALDVSEVEILIAAGLLTTDPNGDLSDDILDALRKMSPAKQRQVMRLIRALDDEGDASTQ